MNRKQAAVLAEDVTQSKMSLQRDRAAQKCFSLLPLEQGTSVLTQAGLLTMVL